MTAKAHIPFARPDITDAEVEAVASCVRSGWLTTGKNVASFEAEFVSFLGDPDLQAVAVNSATAGLHLALEAAGVVAGDEVLVPTWTFTATAEVVRYLGADPVFVDCDPVTLNMDLAAARRLVTPRTKAIIPVHFAGLAMDHQELERMSDDFGLKVVEDAAHALPASSHGRVVGTSNSCATVYSFYATKTITTGEGGMIVTRDAHVADRARVMRLHGINRDVFDRYTSASAGWFYEVVDAGFKYNMPDPAAAMGRVQLSRANEMRDARASLASKYRLAFEDLPLDLPEPGASDDLHSWHLYVVRIRDDAALFRDEFIDALRVAGVGSSVHFIPLHRHPYWRDRYRLSPTDFPVAEAAYRRCVSLPLFSSMTEVEADKVVHVIRSILS